MSDMDADRREVWTTNGGSMDAEIADLRKRAESAEAKIEWLQKERRSICQIMNGRDDFPGDLPQYIRNEVSGRNAAEAALAESERAGERLGELLSDWQHWYREDVPRMTRVQLEAKTDAALVAWRARKGGEAVAKKLEHPYSPPSQDDLRRMRDANTPKMPRQDDRPMKP